MNETTRTALNAVFDIEPAQTHTDITGPVVSGEIVASSLPAPDPVVLDPEEAEALRQAKQDVEFSRSAIKAIANDAQQSLIRAVEVAEQTDTARAFEAVAAMVRASLDAHKELHQLHKSAAEQRMAAKSASQTATQTPGVTIKNGIVFQGTTAELLRQLKPERT